MRDRAALILSWAFFCLCVSHFAAFDMSTIIHLTRASFTLVIFVLSGTSPPRSHLFPSPSNWHESASQASLEVIHWALAEQEQSPDTFLTFFNRLVNNRRQTCTKTLLTAYATAPEHTNWQHLQHCGALTCENATLDSNLKQIFTAEFLFYLLFS